MIVQQGDPGDRFYVIVRGKRGSSRDEDGRSVQLAKLQDGDYFGEMAFLSDQPRNATVRTLTACVCLSLPRDLFNRLLAREPELREHFEKVLVARAVGAASESSAMRSRAESTAQHPDRPAQPGIFFGQTHRQPPPRTAIVESGRNIFDVDRLLRKQSRSFGLSARRGLVKTNQQKIPAAWPHRFHRIQRRQLLAKSIAVLRRGRRLSSMAARCLSEISITYSASELRFQTGNSAPSSRRKLRVAAVRHNPGALPVCQASCSGCRSHGRFQAVPVPAGE